MYRKAANKLVTMRNRSDISNESFKKKCRRFESSIANYEKVRQLWDITAPVRIDRHEAKMDMLRKIHIVVFVNEYSLPIIPKGDRMEW